MVKEFSTFGSCSSRNIFTSVLNKGYKNFFHINFSLESVTLISQMSKPVQFDSNLLNSPHKYDNYCVYHDLKKIEYLEFIKKTNLDYLVFDTYFDVLYDIIVLDDNTFISCSERLMNTDLFKQYEHNERISIENEFDEFMDIWTNAFDSFFKFIKDNNNDCKIILNCSRPVYMHYSSLRKGIIESSMLTRKVPVYHESFRDILDRYILKNYDVNVLPFDYDTLSDENHYFGLHPTHYEPKYYKEKTDQLNDIIKLNENYEYSNKYNLEKREKARNDLILKFKENKLSKFKHRKNMGTFESLSKYLTARIDVKNEGTESNNIEFLEISDKNISITTPPWFCDMAGTGKSIHSKKGTLDLKIKCINDGNLLIRLMGMDSRDDLGNRIPIYIRFTDFIINGEKIITKDEIVSHDNSFKFRKDVENSEIIAISVCWQMY